MTNVSLLFYVNYLLQAHIKEDKSFVFEDQEFDDEVDIEEEENEEDDSDIAGYVTVIMYLYFKFFILSLSGVLVSETLFCLAILKFSVDHTVPAHESVSPKICCKCLVV